MGQRYRTFTARLDDSRVQGVTNLDELRNAAAEKEPLTCTFGVGRQGIEPLNLRIKSRPNGVFARPAKIENLPLTRDFRTHWYSWVPLVSQRLAAYSRPERVSEEQVLES